MGIDLVLLIDDTCLGFDAQTFAAVSFCGSWLELHSGRLSAGNRRGETRARRAHRRHTAADAILKWI